MPLDEIFDIFDERMIKTGTASRQAAHTHGLWHQTFHCWILNKAAKGKESLLFQLRHKEKDTFPNMLDTSCAGHLLSGETVEDGVRELQEELDISVPFTDLTYCGMVAEETIMPGQWIDREFHHVFIYECDKPLNEYTFQISEITGLFLVNLAEFKQLLTGNRDAVMADGIVIDEAEEILHRVARKFCIEDFTPNCDEYYKILFDKIEQMIG